MSKSNSRRFVRAAWSLLFFQMIASVGAVVATGYAVFYVQDLVRAQPPAPEPAPAPSTQPTPASTDTATTMQPAPTDTVTPGDGAAPAPAAPAPATTPPATTEAAIAPCPTMRMGVRVPANVEWCGTSINLRAGQVVDLRVAGQWSNEGPPAYGPGGIGGGVGGTLVNDAPLGALVGRVGSSEFVIGQETRFVSPADGTLYLAINDVRGTYGDNQGALTVYLAPQ